MRPPLPHLAVAALAALLTAACDQPPSSEGLRQWTPRDHAQEQSTPSPNQGAPSRGAKGDGGGIATLVEVTWQQQCAMCHGKTGHGDGPQGPMYKPPDLTSDAVQNMSDADLMHVIQNGKGKMPKFGVSDELARGLVARVRALRGGR